MTKDGQIVRNTALERLSKAIANSPFSEVLAGDLHDVCLACGDTDARNEIQFVKDFLEKYDGVPGTRKRLITSELQSLVSVAMSAKTSAAVDPVRELQNTVDLARAAAESAVAEKNSLANEVAELKAKLAEASKKNKTN